MGFPGMGGTEADSAFGRALRRYCVGVLPAGDVKRLSVDAVALGGVLGGPAVRQLDLRTIDGANCVVDTA